MTRSSPEKLQKARQDVRTMSPRMWVKLSLFLSSKGFTVPRRQALDIVGCKSLDALHNRGLVTFSGDWLRPRVWHDIYDDRGYTLTDRGVMLAQAFALGRNSIKTS